jgi:hypothetical protein
LTPLVINGIDSCLEIGGVMLRPQMLEAVFVAGSVLVGMTGPLLKWDKLVAVSQQEVSFGYEFVSGVETGALAEIREMIRVDEHLR